MVNPTPTKIVIEMDAAGRIRVGGPLDDKILCYGLLEVARQTIQAHQPTPQIAKPSAGEIDHVERNGRVL